MSDAHAARPRCPPRAPTAGRVAARHRGPALLQEDPFVPCHLPSAARAEPGQPPSCEAPNRGGARGSPERQKPGSAEAAGWNDTPQRARDRAADLVFVGFRGWPPGTHTAPHRGDDSREREAARAPAGQEGPRRRGSAARAIRGRGGPGVRNAEARSAQQRREGRSFKTRCNSISFPEGLRRHCG